MSTSYEDWLFQAFETPDLETPAANAGPIDRDVARYYYQGYIATEIEYNMKIDKVSTILQRLQTVNGELWKFISGVHARNRALRMWVLDEIEKPDADTTEDEIKAINKRNVVRHFLNGKSVDDIQETVPDAETILKDIKTESPALHAFIHLRNETITANKANDDCMPFDVGTETEVFLWNTQRYTVETFGEFLLYEDIEDIVGWWRHIRTLPNSQCMPKYHLFTPEKMQKILDAEAAVDAELEQEDMKRKAKREAAQKTQQRLATPIEAWHERQAARAAGKKS
jgi:hypothetical protein